MKPAASAPHPETLPAVPRLSPIGDFAVNPSTPPTLDVPVPPTAARFHPHPLLRNGHLQTLAGFYLPNRGIVESASRHHVLLADGDQIVLHDDRPAGWQPGERTALLIHGLAGCYTSPYMQRIARKLQDRGVRTFRMDLRGCGAGAAWARWPYHSGRSDDADAALRKIAELCPGSPCTLVGFSLGGNISLKLSGESADSLPSNLDRVMAVSPPVDLAHCVENLRRRSNRIYDQYFVRMLLRQIDDRRQTKPDGVFPDFAQPPRGMAEFDELFTAPVCGFGTAANYYGCCSSAQFLPRIRIPALILSAADDPLVPSTPLASAAHSAAVQVEITPRGGHLGFISRRSQVADARWMDWRVVNWVVEGT